jgi:hypothetical protein
LLEAEVRPGDSFFFGLVHSLEKIPWNEYYHIEADGEDFYLILDSISVPAFGAGVPENRGKTCRIENGIIFMEEIGERFDGLDWINSHSFVRDIAVNGKTIARGRDLPEHTRLVLALKKQP